MVLDLQIGCLNLDTLKDLVLILKSKNESIPDSVNKQQWARPLIILFQHKDKSYKLKLRIDSLVLCQTCGGMVDPYNGLGINNHSISLNFYGGTRERWARQLEFLFDQQINDFILTKDDESGYDSLNLDSIFPVKTHYDAKKSKTTMAKYKMNWE